MDASYFIKLGGGLITDKSRPRHIRRSILSQIAQELGVLYQDHPKATWLIGNGAGSFGHYTVHAVQYKDAPADPERIAAVRQSVIDLNKEVVEALQAEGVPAVSLPPHTFMKETNRVEVVMQKLTDCYRRGAVPVVYGDVINTQDGASRIISTEEVLEVIGKAWPTRVTACIYASGVAGVLDKQGKTIPLLHRTDSLHVHDNQSDYDVTGGMAQKVAAGFDSLAFADHVYIVDGAAKGHLSQAVRLEAVDTQLQA